MERAMAIHDEEYLSFLNNALMKKRYEMWKQKMLENIDSIVECLEAKSVEDVMTQWNLTQKDIALLVRLGFLTKEEATKYNLWEIERSAPL